MDSVMVMVMETPTQEPSILRLPDSLLDCIIREASAACAAAAQDRHWGKCGTPKSTLRRISIRCINAAGLAGFVVRDFPHPPVHPHPHPHPADAPAPTPSSAHTSPTYFLAWRLRLFHWSLTAEDQQRDEKLHDLGPGEEGFLREFATLALRAAVPLQELRITFTPGAYVYVHVYSPDASQVYLLDWMDALDAEFRARGVRVTYNAPSVSRVAFAEAQAAARTWDRN
ncbi:hypothetical protein BJY00DRAFT_308546 [Aspergillus carlsbadensis]|nr:hypothetical protein BJY00DRAFT_308546 [Aspergillus carlsbadensis]